MLNNLVENTPVNGTKECDYDIKKFPIREYLANQFKCKSENLENEIANLPKNQSTKIGHDLFKKKEFKNSFKLLLNELELIYGPIAYQKSPTFRTQLNNERSVPFHSDDISSGHPDNIINIWIPTTDLSYENTVHFVSAQDSRYLKDKFINDRLTINQMDKQARKISTPFLGNYGKLIFFSNKTLHGTVVNKSKKVRISIDFRILPITKNMQLNKKIIGRDYIIHKNNSNVIKGDTDKFKKNATSVVYCNNKVSNLSHSMQRSIINSFAEMNSFQITRETSEWQVDHYPIISEIIEEQPEIPILIATELSFDLNITRTKNLINKLSNHPGGAYFCLENKKI